MDGMEEFIENPEIVQNAPNIQNAVLLQNENHNLEELVQNLANLVITEHKRGWEVYLAARDGQSKSLTGLLMNEPEEERASLVNTLYQDGEQSTTPLIIAARNGHTNVVTTLLDNFNTDVEAEGVVKFDGHMIEGATALWCAAGAGHQTIVESLVAAGADVNHVTKTNSTPLRAACFEGRLDIVKFLCEMKADFHIANKYNNTCLMISCYKGHQEVVEYLLNAGADPNTKALCGASALHFSAEIGNVPIVQCLLDHGARMEPNEHGMTPLKAAAERCQAVMVDFLIERPEITVEQQIEALELVGASFANDKDNYDVGMAYRYMERGMKLRWQEEKVVEKVLGAPIAAYDNWRETRTVEELERIGVDSNAVHMEGLAIRERILGSENPEVPHPVIFRGAVFADSARFDRCAQLWLHALRLRQATNLPVTKDLLRFAQVFSQMIKVGLEVDVMNVKEVLNSTVIEIERNQEKIANPGVKDDPEALQEEMENNCLTSLYLIMILTKVSKKEEKVEFAAMKEIYRLVQLNPLTSTGSSLLHLTVNQQTPVDDFHTNEVCKFPCSSTTKLLLQAGADPQAVDRAKNTPLHIIVSYKKIVSDFLTLHAIIMALLESGAHIDSVNAASQTPLAASAIGVAEIILKSQSEMSLKCLAAQSIRKYNLPYQGQVPKSLESFIYIHGP